MLEKKNSSIIHKEKLPKSFFAEGIINSSNRLINKDLDDDDTMGISDDFLTKFPINFSEGHLNYFPFRF